MVIDDFFLMSVLMMPSTWTSEITAGKSCNDNNKDNSYGNENKKHDKNGI